MVPECMPIPLPIQSKKYRKLVNNAVFIRNVSLFFVSIAVNCAFQLEHMLWLLRSTYPVGYEYELSNLGKYLSCRSMGNTMGEYARYIIKSRYLHTYKCCHSPPLLTDIITTAGSHFKSGLSQWCEPWLSCDDGCSSRSIYNLLTVVTLFFVPETNLILSDISWISSISRWVPCQCHWRLVWVNSCCQVLNWVRSESWKWKSTWMSMFLTHFETIQIFNIWCDIINMVSY